MDVVTWLDKIVEPERVRGHRFANLVYSSVKAAIKDWEDLRERERVVVNEILMGGRFYDVPRAIYEVFGYSPLTGYIKIQSRERPGSVEGSIKFSRLVEGEIMVVGDTVASGGTMDIFLSMVKPEEMFLITIGTEEGVNHIKWVFRGKIHVRFIPFPVRLNPKNRTDMPVNLDILPQEIVDDLLSRITEDILKVQCIIGDFSDSIMNIPAFLSEWFAILSQMRAYLEWRGDRKGAKIVEERGGRIVRDLIEWTDEIRARKMVAEALTRRQRLKGYEDVFTPDDVTLSVREMSNRLEEHHWDEMVVWD